MSNHQSTYQYWLSYATSTFEIDISDAAYSIMLGIPIPYTAPSLTTGEWHHICSTFSYSSLTKRIYYDGVQIGSGGTPSGRKVTVPGSLMLGQLHLQYGGGINPDYFFGGTMFGTAIYSIELSPDQIQELYTQGRCAGDSTESLTDVTFLSWQDILKEERQGNVVEEELECDAEHDHPDEDENTDQADHPDEDENTDQDKNAEDENTGQDNSAKDEDADHSEFRKNQSTRVVITCGHFCTICYIFIVMKIFGI